MTVIVYACALVGIIFWARVADKTNCRGFPIVTWSATNLAGYTKRGASVALINMAAQAFSISGNQAYVDPPYCKSKSNRSLFHLPVHSHALRTSAFPHCRAY
jgi:hypothetical protein